MTYCPNNTSNPSQTAPPTGNQACKFPGLWGTSHSNNQFPKIFLSVTTHLLCLPYSSSLSLPPQMWNLGILLTLPISHQLRPQYLTRSNPFCCSKHLFSSISHFFPLSSHSQSSLLSNIGQQLSVSHF